jgi:hypothetical protein
VHPGLGLCVLYVYAPFVHFQAKKLFFLRVLMHGVMVGRGAMHVQASVALAVAYFRCQYAVGRVSSAANGLDKTAIVGVNSRLTRVSSRFVRGPVGFGPRYMHVFALRF